MDDSERSDNTLHAEDMEAVSFSEWDSDCSDSASYAAGLEMQDLDEDIGSGHPPRSTRASQAYPSIELTNDDYGVDDLAASMTSTALETASGQQQWEGPDPPTHVLRYLHTCDKEKYTTEATLPKRRPQKQKEPHTDREWGKPKERGATQYSLRFEFAIHSERPTLAANHWLRNKGIAKSNIEAFEGSHIQEDKVPAVDADYLNSDFITLDNYIGQALSRGPLRATRITPTYSGSSLQFQIRDCPFTALDTSGLSDCQTFRIGSTETGAQFFEADEAEVDVLRRRLEFLLRRVEGIQFGQYRNIWRFLRAVINRLIRHAKPPFHFKATINSPCAAQHSLVGATPELRVPLQAFNLNTANPHDYIYFEEIRIVLPELILTPISDLYEERYIA